jgi:hypothetical protein
MQLLLLILGISVLTAVAVSVLVLSVILLYRHAGRVWRFACHPLTRYVAAWLVAVGVAGLQLRDSYCAFDDSRRRDGNNGHTTIDFGGQWVMGRMVVEGQGRRLYDREAQRQLLYRHFRREDEPPDQKASDAEQLMVWFMGKDDSQAAETLSVLALLGGALPQESPNIFRTLADRAVLQELWKPRDVYRGARAAAPLAAQNELGFLALAEHAAEAWPEDRPKKAGAVQTGGPLYPPINALVFYPLGLMRPNDAYHANQIVGLVLALLAGLGIRQLAQGRIWWPVAVVGVIGFPGFKGSCTLGQNSALTLTIVIWGWVLIAAGRPGRAGVVWGLLAFKPVWALAIFLVPFLTRRWRVCLTMIGTGIVLALATLPFCYRPREPEEPLGDWAPGVVQPWRDWLHVGHEAAELYDVDENWIFLSRDLLSIPRRWLLEFGAGSTNSMRREEWLPPAVVGWALFVFVLELTVRLAVLRRQQARALTGPAPAFLFLGAWMTCYHFMYYDLLLAALPVFLLLTEPRRFLQPKLLAIRPLAGGEAGKDLAAFYGPRPPTGMPPAVPPLAARHGHVWVLNSFTLTLIALLYATEHALRNMGVEVMASGRFLQSWPVVASVPLKQPVKFSTEWMGTPTDTFCLLVLWLWCGWQWLRLPRPAPRSAPGRVALGPAEGNGPFDAAEFVEFGADVGGSHERLPDQHGAHAGGL